MRHVGHLPRIHRDVAHDYLTITFNSIKHFGLTVTRYREIEQNRTGDRHRVPRLLSYSTVSRKGIQQQADTRRLRCCIRNIRLPPCSQHRINDYSVQGISYKAFNQSANQETLRFYKNVHKSQTLDLFVMHSIQYLTNQFSSHYLPHICLYCPSHLHFN